jgi:hypothetical protein
MGNKMKKRRKKRRTKKKNWEMKGKRTRLEVRQGLRR